MSETGSGKNWADIMASSSGKAFKSDSPAWQVTVGVPVRLYLWAMPASSKQHDGALSS